MTDCPRTVWYKTEKSTWVKSNQHATRMEPENVANKHNECHCAELQSQADLQEWGHHVSLISHFSFFSFKCNQPGFEAAYSQRSSGVYMTIF